jgi:LAO/AO transport system kinase
MPASGPRTKSLTLSDYRKGILSGNRIILAQAITLVESDRTKDQALSEKLLENLLPATGKSFRVGITGSPGVGKSSFLEVFGKFLTSKGKRVAVLVVDPSSQKTKGSILGDKTRMDELSKDPLAFIRPSASRSILGGVTESMHESILLCEAAGFDIILIETVGVGQSEVAVRGMVDFFLLMMLAGAGDELQGIKRGIIELSDAIVITKAEGENIQKASQARTEFSHALHWFQPRMAGWRPPVIVSSSVDKTGISEIWNTMESFEHQGRTNGFFKSQRQEQNLEWFHESLEGIIRRKAAGRSKQTMASLEKKVASGKITPRKAARTWVKGMK